MSLLSELKRRKVFRVGAAYLAVSWLVVQVVNNVGDPLHLPPQMATIVVVLLAVGLPIALLLAWAYELTPDGIRRTERSTAGSVAATAGAERRGRLLNYAITAVLALAVSFLLIDRFRPGGAKESPVLTDAAVATAAGGASAGGAAANDGTPAEPGAIDERIRVAVLPFRNLSSVPEAGYLAEGLSAQLTSELKQIPELLVTDPRAAFRFVDSNLSHQEIAAELGVAHVLEGRVTGGNGTLRISVELTRAADDEQLDAISRDFNGPDMLAIQDEITHSVATNLQVTLGVLARGRVGMTDDVEAYNAYLSGLGHSNRFSADETREAQRYFERAIAVDPGFVRARMALAASHFAMAVLVPQADSAVWRARGVQVLARARDFADDELSRTMLDGMQSFYDADWSATAGAIARLDALGGFGLEGRSLTLGNVYLRTGRIEEAIGLLEEARATDPFQALAAFFLGTAYAARGDLAAAMAEIDRGVELAEASGENLLILQGATWLTPLTARNRPELERRLAAARESSTQLPETMLALLDDRDAALAEIRRRLADAEGRYALDRGNLAHFAAYFGDPDLALEILRSLPPDTPFLPLMLWTEVQAETRKLPGFKALVEDLGLVAYWREYGWGEYCHPLGTDDFACD